MTTRGLQPFEEPKQELIWNLSSFFLSSFYSMRGNSRILTELKKLYKGPPNGKGLEIHTF